MTRLGRRALALGIVAAALLSGCSDSGAGGTEDAGYVSGDGSVTEIPPDRREPSPDLAGETLDGRSFDLDDHRGEVVVVNVWGSWCPPCRAEAPILERVWRDLRDDGVQFVGINTRDNRSAAQAYERRFDITFPSVVDDGEVLLGFRDTLPPQAIPSTLVIDRQGRVAARAVGAVTESRLRGMLEPVVAEAP